MRKITAIAISALIVGLFLYMGAEAQRVQILDDVQVVEESECAVIRVGFNIPMRYIKHFPYKTGEDLRIQLEAISVSPAEKDSLFNREFLRSPPNDIAGLTDVIYEGNVTGGPFLTLYFDRSVTFKVDQGEDFRSIIITVSGPEATAPCESGW